MFHSVTLSSKGLNNLQWSHYEKDFKFDVGGQNYFCPSFVAEFLSRRISKHRLTDFTIQEFHIETVDSSNCFERFLSLGYGLSVCFDSNDTSFIRSLCVELDSIDLYEQLFLKDQNELRNETIINRLKELESLGCSSESEIEYAASHAIDLKESIFELNVSTVSVILQHKSLKLENEDTLCEHIIKILKDPEYSEYSSLLEFIRFEYLSKSSIESFIDFICDKFHFLTKSVWNSLDLD